MSLLINTSDEVMRSTRQLYQYQFFYLNYNIRKSSCWWIFFGLVRCMVCNGKHKVPQYSYQIFRYQVPMDDTNKIPPRFHFELFSILEGSKQKNEVRIPVYSWFFVVYINAWHNKLIHRSSMNIWIDKITWTNLAYNFHHYLDKIYR